MYNQPTSIEYQKMWSFQSSVIGPLPLFIISALRGYIIVGISPSVCLFVNSAIQKPIDRFSSNFAHCPHMLKSKSWLNFADVNVTVAYFKATLKFMGPLSWRRSALCEYSSLAG